MRAILVLAVAAVAACAARQETETEASASAGLGDFVGDWDATLQPQNNSGVTGTARVQSALAASAVTITISGATANAHHPWHVHTGTCGSGGPIVGAANAYPALHVATNGTATATASIGVALNEEQKYHVNVHRSEAELNVIISCGNLDD